MKLSDYAKSIGVSYKTAWRYYRAGSLDAYQTDTGTIIVRDSVKNVGATRVALYARVSSADQKQDLARQIDRLETYAAAKGYSVAKSVTEVASGLNDKRPKLSALLTDPSIGVIVVEHRERLTRFGFNHIIDLLSVQGRTVEVILPNELNDDLVEDFIAVITSMCARLYGRRGSKNRAQKVIQCMEAGSEIVQD